jgi:hypothetical protein
VSQDEAAAKLNVSPRSVRAAKAVQEKAEPEVQRAVDAGRLSINAAAQIAELPKADQVAVMKDDRPDRAVKKVARAHREEELAAKQTALPAKKYGVILADPEWKFEVRSERGMDRAADNHYPTSSTDEIARRDVASIAADDCVLFLWATVPMLPDALRVMEAWGFAYKSSAVWVKDRVGTGYPVRSTQDRSLTTLKSQEFVCPRRAG